MHPCTMKWGIHVYVYVDMLLMISSPPFPGAARPCRQQHCDHVGGEQEWLETSAGRSNGWGQGIRRLECITFL